MSPTPPNQNPEEQKRLLVALALSVVILLAFHFLYERPRMEELKRQQEIAEAQNREAAPPDTETVHSDETEDQDTILPRSAALQLTKRIHIENPAVKGSIPLTGNRIDDIQLSRYFVTTENKHNVTLLSPSRSEHAYYAEFGWVGGDMTKNINLPGPETVWTLRSPTGSDVSLSPATPLVMTWDNGQGLLFERKISIDDEYLITVTQSVINNTGEAIKLFPYALITRHETPEILTTMIMHQGPLAYFNKDLHEYSYDDLAEEGTVTFEDDQGWIGITDKYWLAALIPNQKEMVKARMVHSDHGEKDYYQVDLRGEARVLSPNTTASSTVHLFAGAKELAVLNKYEEKLAVPHFDLAVDFGIFYFLTKPFFIALTWLYAVTGNFGIAILIFTVFLRIIVFPLANKSFISMAKTREIQPKLLDLREKFGHDKQRLQEEIMKIYQRENVNPLSGCMLMLLQIPIFFSLYKVLYVTIEMRHAPFYGWITDLSAPDPTTIFNLFGLIPWQPPQFLMIGVWPLIMLVTMILQRRLQPEPPDPMQAKMMAFMPFILCFILAKFAAGLVIYWAWNNFLSMIQQYTIMRRMGIDVSLLRRPTRDQIQAAGRAAMVEPNPTDETETSTKTGKAKGETAEEAHKKSAAKNKKSGNKKTGSRGGPENKSKKKGQQDTASSKRGASKTAKTKRGKRGGSSESPA